MKLDFDFENVEITEFGIGRYEDDDRRTFYFVPVDAHVKIILKEMAKGTWAKMNNLTEEPSRYDPSEKYSGEEYLYFPLDDELVLKMKELHSANNLPIANNTLADIGNIYFYFVHLTDKEGRRLTALRRATQFKGVIKKRLIRIVDDTLKLIEGKVFKLDNDFDLLIDNTNIFILRPKGFESIGELEEALLAAVPQNIQNIQKELDFIDFSTIQEYAIEHPRAANYIASIHSQGEMNDIDKNLLKNFCNKTGVEINEVNGKIIVDEKHIMGFLKVLDRRRYGVELVRGLPETYDASSRSKVDNSTGDQK